MSPAAKAYQKQITCCSPINEFYITDGTTHAHLDGYRHGVLLEAKYYIGTIQSMPLARVRRLLHQARRQSYLAHRAGLPLVWHVASRQAAQDLCRLFENYRVTGILVRHTPPALPKC
jgi:hypothetical protein